MRRVLVAKGVEGWLLRELKRLGADYTLVPRIELDALLRTTHHQGVAAEVEEPPYATLEDALRLAEARKETPLLVALDGITDPRNYGAMIRSALALGAHGVVSEERRFAPLSPLALKASAGAALKIPVVKVKNLPRALKDLKERGLWVYGLDVRGRRPRGNWTSGGPWSWWWARRGRACGGWCGRPATSSSASPSAPRPSP